MRSVLAKIDGVEPSNVAIDYDAKLVSVDVTGTDVTLGDVVKAFEGTQYGVVGN